MVPVPVHLAGAFLHNQVGNEVGTLNGSHESMNVKLIGQSRFAYETRFYFVSYFHTRVGMCSLWGLILSGQKVTLGKWVAMLERLGRK